MNLLRKEIFMQFYSIAETAQYLGVSRQAIYLQKKSGNIKTFFDQNGKEKVTLEEIFRFKNARYNREKHFSDGFVSSSQAAKITGCKLHRIYYLIYHAFLPFKFTNGMYFIHEDDLNKCNVFASCKKNRKKTDDRKISHSDENSIGSKSVRALQSEGSEKKETKKDHKIVSCEFKNTTAVQSNINENCAS